jgi:flavin reductase (DIM6/NTAB) family NADH-FMN oxidoreductase RutF
MANPAAGGAVTGTEGEVRALRLRQALGRFVSGVTIVTTVRDTADDPEVHGMTANAFTSVSLDPPLVLISVSVEAKMDRRIAETGRYGISILSADQEPLCRHFAGAAQRPDLVSFVWRNGLPLVEEALVHLACSVRASHPAGDHTLHIGEVEGLWYRDGAPLVFYAGIRRALARDASRGSLVDVR